MTRKRTKGSVGDVEKRCAEGRRGAMGPIMPVCGATYSSRNSRRINRPRLTPDSACIRGLIRVNIELFSAAMRLFGEKRESRVRSSKDVSPHPGCLRYPGGWLHLQNRRKPLSGPADKELGKADRVSWTIRACYMECTGQDELGRCPFRRLSQMVRIGADSGRSMPWVVEQEPWGRAAAWVQVTM